MRKKPKSTAQLVIWALLSGKRLDSGDISDMIYKKEGRDIKVRDVSSMLSRISNRKDCKLAYFIEKRRKGVGFSYKIVDEALELSEANAYQLTLKGGKGRYTLDDALEEFPDLGKYVKTGPKPAAKSKAKKQPTLKPARKGKDKGDVSAKPSPVAPLLEKEVESLTAAVLKKLRDMSLNVNVSVQLEED